MTANEENRADKGRPTEYRAGVRIRYRSSRIACSIHRYLLIQTFYGAFLSLELSKADADEVAIGSPFRRCYPASLCAGCGVSRGSRFWS